MKKRMTEEQLDKLADLINVSLKKLSFRIDALKDDKNLDEIEKIAKDFLIDEGFSLQTISKGFRVIGLEREDSGTTVHLNIHHKDVDVDIDNDIVDRSYFVTLC